MALRPDMAAAPRVRGRPKGTGIDDRGHLASLHAMLAQDGALKPTTAIKRLGITDPSAIRRLRDKLAEPALAQVPVSTSRPPTQPLKAPTPEIKKAAAPKPTPPAAPSTPPAQPTPPAAPPIPSPPVSPTAAAPAAAPPASDTLAAETKAREQALLAAYLQAMMKAPPAEPEPPLPEPPKKAEAPKPEPKAEAPRAETKPQSPFAFPGFPPMPPFPGMPQMPNFMGMPSTPPSSGGGFNIPGFPSFLQPFQQKQDGQPAPGSQQARQLEAMKLAIEATTAIAKFQLHMVENGAAYSPMAMMLQGQSFIGQMMTAALTGQLDAMRRQMMGEKK